MLAELGESRGRGVGTVVGGFVGQATFPLSRFSP